MNRYILKESKESSGFCKEIEVFRYNGNFNDTNVPDWFIVAKSNGIIKCWDKVDGKDKLMVLPYGANVEDGDYIARKIHSGGIGALSKKMLDEYYDIVDY